MNMTLKNKNTEKSQPASRRNFLKTGVLAGFLATGGIVGASKLLSNEKASGTKIKLLSVNGDVVEVDANDITPHTHHTHHHDVANKMIRKSEGHPGKRYIMVIDLSRCRNARRCVEDCQKMHGLPVNQEYIRVKKMQDSENTAPYWFPQICNHCDNSPCTRVCPVGATYQRSDGIVAMDNTKCIGCRFCMAACPYQTRTFNWGEPANNNVISANHDNCKDQHIKGTVSKCDFCPEMVKKGELPACVTACPNGVFYFGDENEDYVTNGEKTFRFSELIKDRSGYRYMEDLGTKPRVYYLPPVNRSFPFEGGMDNFNKAKEKVNNKISN